MAKALTAKGIENIKPTAQRREVPDGLIPGLYFTIQPSGKQSWAYRYRFNGRPRKFTIGPYPSIDIKTARDRAREAFRLIGEKIDPGVEKKASRAKAMLPANDLVEAVIARFVTIYAKPRMRPVSAHEVERILMKEVATAWPRRRLSEISDTDVNTLLDGIVARGSPITANRTLAWLRRLCSWAKGRKLLTANPCDGVEAPADEIARDRFLSDDELLAVWRAAEAQEPPYDAFLKLLILTGARRNEVAEMKWSEVNCETKTWVLPKERAKNKRAHEIPLSDLAFDILQACPRIDGSDLVFTLNGKNRITAFHLTKQRVDALMPDDVLPWTLHDLRRTFASGCARLGIAIHVVEALLNHKSGAIKGVAAVYNRHDYAPEKQSAVATWANYVSALVSGETQSNVRHITKT
ncbi:MAG TPA: integrase arm-type DNA-binding domain-containing protein [Methylocella sp.]|jgi:integrase